MQGVEACSPYPVNLQRSELRRYRSECQSQSHIQARNLEAELVRFFNVLHGVGEVEGMRGATGIATGGIDGQVRAFGARPRGIMISSSFDAIKAEAALTPALEDATEVERL